MNRISIEPLNELFDARYRVKVYCQSLVDAGKARWQVNKDGETELHMGSGEAYLLGELGVTQLR